MKFFNKILTDIQESYNELVYKVSWPTKKDLVNSTVVVMSASIIFALVIFCIDFVFNTMMEYVYKLPQYLS